mmetsp:Transcript_33868/g.36550  ORF Transcript_33868/g.36550 Transcript_33868/m.36550 type:complete len:327 (-) Transcript_33868:98-1078(-)
MTASTRENRTDIISNVLGSASAGIIARTVTHPLDTAKARLQSLSGTSYHGPFDVLRSTFRNEGIIGLYRGFGTVIIGGTPGTIIYLCSYDIFKDRLSSASEHNEESSVVHFMSGILAETVACVVYVPVDVIKERLQIQYTRKTDKALYNNGWDALIKISKTEGISGIYKGYGATLASYGPFSAFYFAFYEQFKSWSKIYHLQQKENNSNKMAVTTITTTLPLSYTILCSAGAGAIASFLTSPLDMVKLRLQVQRGTQTTPLSTVVNDTPTILHRGMSDALTYAWRTGGFTGLFKGAGARVLHFVPLTTVTMTSYETCRIFFNRHLV